MEGQKVAVITGGTKGIGKALVEKFLLEGFRVLTCAREVNGVEWNSSALQPDCFKADLSQSDEVQAFINWVKQETQKIHVLINNAGVFLPGNILSEPEENFINQMNLNLSSVYHICRGLQGSWEDSETYIANVCSTASFVAYTNGGSYCVSKFALLGLTKVLREELKERNIAVSAVMPGATYTNSWAGTDLPLDRFMNPENLAEFVWVAYSNRKNAVMEDIVLRPMQGDL